jgi:hypothetical protein
MNFGELLAELYDDLGYASSPASAVVTRIKRAINTAHQAIHAEPGLASLRYGTLTIASVASQARYGLSHVAQVRAFTETTNDLELKSRTLGWYRARNPDPASNEGTPEVYIPLGQVAVAQVPASTGTGLWIVSSSASDTVPTVTVDAIRVGGYPHSPSAATVNGTTRVQIGGASGLTDYIDVTQFQLSTACVGDISLYDASSSGNLLAVIPRGQTSSRYWGFILSPTPSDAITYTVDVEHEILPLVNDTDEPLLPQLFHRLPGIKARMKEYEGKDDARFAAAEKEYARELQKLKYSRVGEDVIVPGGSATEGGSNLGPWFEAGRWSES